MIVWNDFDMKADSEEYLHLFVFSLVFERSEFLLEWTRIMYCVTPGMAQLSERVIIPFFWSFRDFRSKRSLIFRR